MMKRLLALALVAVMAGGALAENEAGLWYSAGGGNFAVEFNPTLFVPFDMVLTVADPSYASIAAYEVSIVNFPASILIQSITWAPSDGINFGSNFNQIVGYGAPIPASDLTILATMTCIATAAIDPTQIEYRAASSQSIPGHDGMVIANGANPDELAACPTNTGTPWVFTFAGPGPTSVEAQTLSGVKALFE